MHKKLLYITIILAMVFGAIGLMGTQEAYAVDMGPLPGPFANAFAARGTWNLQGLGPGSLTGGSVFGATRDAATDPTACNAGGSTVWAQFGTGIVGAVAPRFLSVAARADFDAVVVITNAANTEVLGCMNVPADGSEILTIPITSGLSYNVMVAERQGYPLAAGELIDIAVMQSRYEKPNIVQDLATAGVTPTWRTPNGLATTVNADYTVAAPDANGFSFFDVDTRVPASAGPNHMAWSNGFGTVLFRTSEGPSYNVLNPFVTTTAIGLISTGAPTAVDVSVVPSAWQVNAEMSNIVNYQLGAIGCAGVANLVPPNIVCTLSLEPGTYDVMLTSTAAAADPYYMLSARNQLFTAGFAFNDIDFRPAAHPQATIQLNSEAVEGLLPGLTIDFVARASQAFGDVRIGRSDEEQIQVSTGLATEIEVRLAESGWIYALDPVFIDGLEAVSRTFAADEEVNVRLDTGRRQGISGNMLLPYGFNSTTAMNNFSVTTTDFVDAIGNSLARVSAPNGTLLPATPGMDNIEPNTLVLYGANVLYNEFHWDNVTVTVDDPSDVGRYYAQRALLTGPNFRAGDNVNVFVYRLSNPLNIDVTLWQRGSSAVEALTTGDMPETHWAFPWVMSMYEQGLTAGIGGGLYGTDNVMLRQEMATFLSRIMREWGVPATGAAADFADLGQASDWAQESIQHLRDLGITEGCDAEANLFCPMDEVTRAEVAPFILKTFRVIERYNPGTQGLHWGPAGGAGVNQEVFFPGTTFVDVPTDHWANIWVEEMVAKDLTDGCRTEMSGGSFIHFYCLEDPVTRAEWAIFFVGALQDTPVTQLTWPILSPER